MVQASSSSAPEPEPEQAHEPSSQLQPQLPSPSIPIPKKTPPLPWSHLETVHLIEAYQEKWYSLKRGQLKAHQWEEVSLTIASRCGYNEPSKTSTQCRHKMEKLRKRYRSEKQRSTPSTWPYFDLMDHMERGPFPISARPIPSMAAPLHHPIFASNSSDEDDEDDNNDLDERNKSRSINHILRRHPIVSSDVVDKSFSPRQWNSSGGGGNEEPGVSRFLRNPMFRKRRKSFEIDENEEDEEEDEGRGGELLSELASVVRAFGEGFVRMENMKMEMMKETERFRMEMEMKRTEMILESQHRIVDAIAKVFGSQKKPKKAQEM